jgi:hypothetical protein
MPWKREDSIETSDPSSISTNYMPIIGKVGRAL